MARHIFVVGGMDTNDLSAQLQKEKEEKQKGQTEEKRRYDIYRHTVLVLLHTSKC